MEMIDVVTKDGEPTGQVVSKQKAHEQGLWHRDVHVWVTNGTHMLQQQRDWEKDIMPGQWDISASGHVGQGESYLAAAVRELEEEVGMTAAKQQLIPLGILAFEMTFPGWKVPHRVAGQNFALYAPGVSLGDITVQPSEVTDARFYPIDQLEHEVEHARDVRLHAEQPLELWRLGIAGMRAAAYNSPL